MTNAARRNLTNHADFMLGALTQLFRQLCLKSGDLETAEWAQREAERIAKL